MLSESVEWTPPTDDHQSTEWVEWMKSRVHFVVEDASARLRAISRFKELKEWVDEDWDTISSRTLNAWASLAIVLYSAGQELGITSETLMPLVRLAEGLRSTEFGSPAESPRCGKMPEFSDVRVAVLLIKETILREKSRDSTGRSAGQFSLVSATKDDLFVQIKSYRARGNTYEEIVKRLRERDLWPLSTASGTRRQFRTVKTEADNLRRWFGRRQKPAKEAEAA